MSKSINKSIKITLVFAGSIVLIISLWLLTSLYLAGQSKSLVFQNQVSWASVPNSNSLNYDINWLKTDEKKYFSVWELKNSNTDEYLIYLHGNAGRLLHFFEPLSTKFNVVSPAYLGYSESEGSPSMETSFEIADRTYKWLVAKGIPESKITIFGHSLGGSVASHLASTTPQAKQLVLVNTFSSVQSMCIRQYGALCVFTSEIFNSLNYAKSFQIPVKHFAYKGDTTVPFEENKELFKGNSSKNKQFFEMEGFTHSYPDFQKILTNIN